MTSKALTTLADSWTQLLESLASGMPFEEALAKHRITSKEVTQITLVPAEAAKFFEAQAAARRLAFPIWDFEAVCVRVTSGMTARAAVVAVRGADDCAAFFELLETDAALATRFEAAERAGARATEDELLELADDKSGDVLQTDKGPIPSSAAVGRSKLQVDTRMRLKVAHNRDRYSEKAAPTVAVNVEVNHAAILEEARVRARDRRATPRVRVIDAEFTEVPPAKAPEASAEKAEPISTVWREGNLPAAPAPAAAPAADAPDPEANPDEPMNTAWME